MICLKTKDEDNASSNLSISQSWKSDLSSKLSTETMKFLLVASLVAAASAFAPQKQAKYSTSLNDYSNELGVLPPVGFFGTILSVSVAWDAFFQII